MSGATPRSAPTGICPGDEPPRMELPSLTTPEGILQYLLGGILVLAVGFLGAMYVGLI